MTDMKVMGLDVCTPIKNVIGYLAKHGFSIIEQRVSAYHFNEVSIDRGMFILQKRYSAIRGSSGRSF